MNSTLRCFECGMQLYGTSTGVHCPNCDRPNTSLPTGWVCPRCQIVHAPLTLECSCRPAGKVTYSPFSTGALA